MRNTFTSGLGKGRHGVETFKEEAWSGLLHLYAYYVRSMGKNFGLTAKRSLHVEPLSPCELCHKTDENIIEDGMVGLCCVFSHMQRVL